MFRITQILSHQNGIGSSPLFFSSRASLFRLQSCANNRRIVRFCSSPPIASDFSSDMKKLVKLKRYATALRLFSREHDLHPEEEAYNMAIICAFKSKWDISKLLKLYTEMKEKGHKTSQEAYEYIIHSLLKSHQYSTILEIYDQMIKAEIFSKKALSAAIIAIEEGKEPMELGASYLQDLVEKGIKPDPETYHAVICGFAKQGKLNLAENWYEEVRDLGYMNNCNRMYHTVMLYSSLEDRIRFLQEMKLHSKPTTKAYNLILDSCAQQQKFDLAQSMYSELIDGEFNIRPDRYTFLFIFYCLRNCKRYREMDAYLKDMAYFEVRCDNYLYGLIIRLSVLGNNLPQALRYFTTMWNNPQLPFSSNSSASASSPTSSLQNPFSESNNNNINTNTNTNTNNNNNNNNSSSNPFSTSLLSPFSFANNDGIIYSTDVSQSTTFVLLAALEMFKELRDPSQLNHFLHSARLRRVEFSREAFNALMGIYIEWNETNSLLQVFDYLRSRGLTVPQMTAGVFSAVAPLKDTQFLLNAYQELKTHIQNQNNPPTSVLAPSLVSNISSNSVLLNDSELIPETISQITKQISPKFATSLLRHLSILDPKKTLEIYDDMKKTLHLQTDAHLEQVIVAAKEKIKFMNAHH
jgi:pentatricopeptide repeat protein